MIILWTGFRNWVLELGPLNPVLELSLSLTSTLVKRQASGEQNSRGQQALGQKRIIFHLAFEIFHLAFGTSIPLEMGDFPCARSGQA